jgi:hypothetical protein
MKLLDNEVTEELYNELLQSYIGIYGGRSNQVLEHKIKSLMEKGLSRAEAIDNLADKEKIIGSLYKKRVGIIFLFFLLMFLFSYFSGFQINPQIQSIVFIILLIVIAGSIVVGKKKHLSILFLNRIYINSLQKNQK